MNIIDLVEGVKRKKEFDFFNKVAYICDNYGRDTNVTPGRTKEEKINVYEVYDENNRWHFFVHVLRNDEVTIHDENSSFNYYLKKKDYFSREFNPVIPERWEKLVSEIYQKELN